MRCTCTVALHCTCMRDPLSRSDPCFLVFEEWASVVQALNGPELLSWVHARMELPRVFPKEWSRKGALQCAQGEPIHFPCRRYNLGYRDAGNKTLVR